MGNNNFDGTEKLRIFLIDHIFLFYPNNI